jgi:hypothetical protein
MNAVALMRAVVVAEKTGDLRPLAAVFRSVDAEAAERLAELVAREPLKGERAIRARQDYLVATEYAALTPDDAEAAIKILHALTGDQAAEVRRGHSRACQPAREHFRFMEKDERDAIKAKLLNALQIPTERVGAGRDEDR